MEIQKNESLKIGKKGSLTSAILLIVIIIFATIILGIIWYSESSGKKYFEKYCEKKSNEHYVCSYQSANIKKYCISKGFKVDEYGSMQCYNFTDENKECNDNSNCNSGICVPFDISCEENCKGQCWNGVNFGTIGSPECIDGKAHNLKGGKVKISPCWLS